MMPRTDAVLSHLCGVTISWVGEGNERCMIAHTEDRQVQAMLPVERHFFDEETGTMHTSLTSFEEVVATARRLSYRLRR
jgi:hypothetical protein